eukprot:351893-Chlamydomonas_euryale.AAC.13
MQQRMTFNAELHESQRWSVLRSVLTVRNLQVPYFRNSSTATSSACVSCSSTCANDAVYRQTAKVCTIYKPFQNHAASGQIHAFLDTNSSFSQAPPLEKQKHPALHRHRSVSGLVVGTTRPLSTGVFPKPHPLCGELAVRPCA